MYFAYEGPRAPSLCSQEKAAGRMDGWMDGWSEGDEFGIQNPEFGRREVVVVHKLDEEVRENAECR